jgi:hypothetical protein
MPGGAQRQNAGHAAGGRPILAAAEKGETGMASVASAEERRVSIGRVFRRAFETLAASPLTTLGIAFLFGALPVAAFGYGFQAWVGSNVGEATSLMTIAVALATAVGGIAVATIAQGALVRLVIVHEQDGKASFGDSVGAGLAVAAPLFAMAILGALGIMLGLLLVIIPGVIAYVSWAVAASALVDERLGPVEALKRSSFLVEGARWKVAGVLLVLIAASWLATLALESIEIPGYRGLAGAVAAPSSAPALIHLAVYAAFDSVSLALWSVVQTSLYIELRGWKEGVPAESLANIFA